MIVDVFTKVLSGELFLKHGSLLVHTIRACSFAVEKIIQPSSDQSIAMKIFI
jgi:hypothetical protein